MVESPSRDIEPVLAVLGGSRVLGKAVRSTEDLLKSVRSGLPFAALAYVMERYQVSRESVYRILQLSERNFQRRKQQGRLSPDESDRLYRLARILAHADQVFEDAEESADWIRTPNASLGKEQPLALLDTDIGVQRVDEVLGRIEHGIVG